MLTFFKRNGGAKRRDVPLVPLVREAWNQNGEMVKLGADFALGAAPPSVSVIGVANAIEEASGDESMGGGSLSLTRCRTS